MIVKKGYFLVIDAGTGSGRAVIFDESGRQIGISQEEWSHHPEDGVEGSMNFDCENNWKLIVRCIDNAIRSANIDTKDILAITSSSMREGIVLYDRDGKEIWALANVDSRAGAQVAKLNREDKKREKRFYKESGQTFALGAIPRLLWLKEHRPEVYEKTYKISMLSDWVLYKICGEIVSEPSNAGTSGIFSLKERRWNAELAKECGLDGGIFPECKESGTIIGKSSQIVAKETLLPSGIPVVLGGGDVQLGCAGLGVIERGECAILGGTFWQQIINMDRPKTDKSMKIRINPHVVEGLYHAEAITFFVGLVMRWFRDGFCHEELKRAHEEKRDAYELLEELSSDVPVGSHGIMPIFSDVMNYGKWYHAAPSFINLNLNPLECNKVTLFRALQENAAIVSALNLDNIAEFSGVESREIVFAGGASKGKNWPQILADVSGKRVRIPLVKEATSLGGAMMAGIASGVYSSVQEAANEIVYWERECEPNMANHRKYLEIKEQWLEIYKLQKELVDKGLSSSMWRAPGI